MPIDTSARTGLVLRALHYLVPSPIPKTPSPFVVEELVPPSKLYGTIAANFLVRVPASRALPQTQIPLVASSESLCSVVLLIHDRSSVRPDLLSSGQ